MTARALDGAEALGEKLQKLCPTPCISPLYWRYERG
jgi:hypothetical protein